MRKIVVIAFGGLALTGVSSLSLAQETDTAAPPPASATQPNCINDADNSDGEETGGDSSQDCILVTDGVSTPSQETKSQTAQGSDRVKCKRMRKTGTRVAKKVCRTVAQWQQLADDARELGQTIKDSGGINSSRPPGS